MMMVENILHINKYSTMYILFKTAIDNINGPCVTPNLPGGLQPSGPNGPELENPQGLIQLVYKQADVKSTLFHRRICNINLIETFLTELWTI